MHTAKVVMESAEEHADRMKGMEAIWSRARESEMAGGFNDALRLAGVSQARANELGAQVSAALGDLPELLAEARIRLNRLAEAMTDGAAEASAARQAQTFTV